MYYVGLDIHHRSTSMEILDCNGKLVKRGPWKLGWPQLADQLAQRVKAAHPGSLRLIYKSKRKNNRVDAGKLARLLYLDAVPSVYVPGKETRPASARAGAGRLGDAAQTDKSKDRIRALVSRTKTRRKKAAVALARKILVWCWAMMRDGTTWDESYARESMAAT